MADGQQMPFGALPHQRDLAVNAGLIDDPDEASNQSAPVLVSNAGRVIWYERPFAYAFDGAGERQLTGQDLVVDQPGDTLATAYRSALSRFFRLRAEHRPRVRRR